MRHHLEFGRARTRSRGHIVTVLFTDAVGSTKLLENLGDQRADRVRRQHFELLRKILMQNGGEEVKSLGDGLMAVFAGTIDAISAAIAIQQAVNVQAGLDPQRTPAVRIGLHAGEPVQDEDDFFGRSVVITRRLCDCAAPGEIVASDLVQKIAEPSGEFAFRDRRLIVLKGISTPVAASTVVWNPPESSPEVDDSREVTKRPRSKWLLLGLVVGLGGFALAGSLLTGDREEKRKSVQEGSGGPTGQEGELDIYVDGLGWANVTTGTAVIVGEVGCPDSGPVRVEVTLVQPQGDRVTRKSDFTTVDCDAGSAWLAYVRGSFEGGEVGVEVAADMIGSSSTAQGSTSVDLRPCTRIGTLGKDKLLGRKGNDMLCGLAGDDLIVGGPGNDKLRGYDGSDKLIGGSGEDLVTGGHGDDLLEGNSGADRLFGDRGSDTLRGGTGIDECDGGPEGEAVASCEGAV